MKFIVKFSLFIIIIVFSQSPVFSQNSTSFFVDTTQHLNLSFGANYSYGSSAVNSTFFNKFIFGGKIEREHKDKVYENLSNKNKLGGDLDYSMNVEIPYDTIFGKTSISLVLGLEHTEHIDLEFSDDLFRFAFDGNKQFAGENADLEVNYNYYKYQQLKAGFISYKNINNKLAKTGMILSFIKGEENEILKAAGGLYTEELGKEIDLDLVYDYNSSDTANKGFSAFNGYGVSTDLFAEHFFKNGDKFYFGVEDLGFIHWNQGSLDVAADSSFHFEGIEVDNIFDLNDSLLSDLSKDSIINSISIINQKRAYSIALPTAVNIIYTKILNEKWKITLGGYYKILSNYFPLISVNCYYYFNPKFVGKVHLSYGGYGKLNTGLAFAKSVATYFDIFIGTNNIETFIAPSSSYNNSGFLGVKAYF